MTGWKALVMTGLALSLAFGFLLVRRSPLPRGVGPGDHAGVHLSASAVAAEKDGEVHPAIGITEIEPVSSAAMANEGQYKEVPHTTASIAREAQALVEATEERLMVQFLVAPAAGPGMISYGKAGQKDGITIPIHEATGASTIAELSPGHWVAAFLSEAGEIGQAAAFEVAALGVVVELAAPGAFDMSFTACNDATGERLQGVHVRASRIDLEAPFFSTSAVEASQIDATTDDAGFARVDGCRFGEYRFTASLDGFESQDFTLALPGPFSDQIEASGSADFGALSMVPLTRFTVQLEGYQDWGGAEGFAIAHTHEGQRFHFGSDGRSQMELGWFSNPLYLKMWFPGEVREAIFYLDGGVPPDGEAWTIDVTKRATLDVDLTIADEVLEQLDMTTATVRATFCTPRGDSTMFSVIVEEPGIYSIPGIGGSAAMVQLVADLDGVETGLAVERVSLGEEKRVSCTLAVSSLPTRVKLVDRDGIPMAEYHLELRERRSSTSWAFGVPSDENGELLAVLPPGLDLSMRVISKDRKTLAVDIPIVWAPNDGALVIRLTSMPPLQLAATLDGVPTPGLEFALIGAHSKQTFILLETNSEGRTAPIQLIEGSTGRIRLVSKDLWMADPIVEVDSGETAVRVYSKGRLKLSPTEDVSRCIHVEEGQSLASWIERGLVKQVPGVSNAWSVPSGTYRLERSDDSVWEEYLAPGATLRVP